MPPLSRYALNIFLKCVSEHLVFAAVSRYLLISRSPFDLYRAGALQARASDPALKSTTNLKFQVQFRFIVELVASARVRSSNPSHHVRGAKSALGNHSGASAEFTPAERAKIAQAPKRNVRARSFPSHRRQTSLPLPKPHARYTVCPRPARGTMATTT